MSWPNIPETVDTAAVASETGFGQCVHALRRTLGTTPAGWFLVTWMCWERAPHQQIWLWLTAFAVTWLLNLWVLRTVAREGPSIARHAARLQGVATLDGITWGAMFWLLMGHDAVLDAWLAAVLAGVSAVNAPVYITYIRAYGLQIGAIWAMALLALLLHPAQSALLQGFAGLTIFYALIAYYMRSIAKRVLEGIGLQLSNAKLAEQLRIALQLVTHDATTDALTGQPNRRALDELLKQQIDLANEGIRPFSVLLLDIDHFKLINDSHGHGVGDDTLRAFAKRVREHLRQGDVCTRYGGEEFVIVLPGASTNVAIEVAERLRHGVGEQPLLNEPLVNPTVSIGVAQYAPGQTIEQLLALADTAVYAAKRNGRNQVRAS